MPLSGTRPRKRLTREESRAQTRAALIAVGRRHFLRYGLGGAVAEKLAEDAGYSRGALYANFGGKEELFVVVIQEEQARHLNVFRSVLKEEPSSKKRLKKMRDTIADLMTDHDWIVLRAEFEVGALQSFAGYVRFEERRPRIRHGARSNHGQSSSRQWCPAFFSTASCLKALPSAESERHSGGAPVPPGLQLQKALPYRRSWHTERPGNTHRPPRSSPPQRRQAHSAESACALRRSMRHDSVLYSPHSCPPSIFFFPSKPFQP